MEGPPAHKTNKASFNVTMLKRTKPVKHLYTIKQITKMKDTVYILGLHSPRERNTGVIMILIFCLLLDFEIMC